MNLVFVPVAWEDYQFWVETDQKTLKKLNKLLKEVKRDPLGGYGKPEKLKHKYSGCYSRRITREHRLIYTVQNDQVCILKCRHHYD